MQQTIIEEVTKFYFDSGDFNGYPTYCLKEQFRLDNEAAKKLVHDLILARKIDVVFGNTHPNPHIKAFSDTSAEQQIEFLNQLEFSDYFCLYPTPEVLGQYGNMPDFGDEPYKRELALGGGSLTLGFSIYLFLSIIAMTRATTTARTL